jgi:hypothetical protein
MENMLRNTLGTCWEPIGNQGKMKKKKRKRKLIREVRE